MDANSDTPLKLDASGYLDALVQTEEETAREIERIKRVYYENDRRDGSAQWWASRWFRLCCFLTAALMVAISAVVFFAVKASQVQAFVQPVQMTDEGKMILLGEPKDLMAYEPEDGHYMDMLAQWTIKRYWRGDDTEMKRTKTDWAWVYRHTCGAAMKFLEGEEAKELPFVPSKLRSSIGVSAIAKTDTPKSYQVNWHEVSVDKLASVLVEKDWITTFTVGRVRPKTMADQLDNRLGMCVNGYSTTPDLKPKRRS